MRVILIAAAILSVSLGAGRAEEGIASVYGYESGSRRADGRPFRPNQVGCAHKTRRLGSVVRVTVTKTGRSIRCPINDRGPYIRGRIIDLSVGAARALGVRGLAHVHVE